MTLCSSSLSELGLQLVIDLFALRDSSYWLVRTELLETLAEMDFRYGCFFFFLLLLLVCFVNPLNNRGWISLLAVTFLRQ